MFRGFIPRPQNAFPVTPFRFTQDPNHKTGCPEGATFQGLGKVCPRLVGFQLLLRPTGATVQGNAEMCAMHGKKRVPNSGVFRVEGGRKSQQ